MNESTSYRLIVHGGIGRMGARVCALAREDDRFKLVAVLDRDEAHSIGENTVDECDVIVDFSSPKGAELAARLAISHGAALVIGTTGLSSQSLDVLRDAARSTAVMIAPNTSLGVAALNHLAVEAARLLGSAFDVDVIETHHTQKRDAPSGTALRLIDVLGEKTGMELGPDRVHCIRAGDVVGDHAIRFAGVGQRLEISHSVTSRDVFAAGALHAAAWLCGRGPGSYTIEQALGVTATES